MSSTTPNPETWIGVADLAAAVGVSRSVIYALISRGQLRHSRVGRRVRVRLIDWQRLHEEHAVEAGKYEPDPARSQRALRAAEKREAAS